MIPFLQQAHRFVVRCLAPFLAIRDATAQPGRWARLAPWFALLMLGVVLLLADAAWLVHTARQQQLEHFLQERDALQTHVLEQQQAMMRLADIAGYGVGAAAPLRPAAVTNDTAAPWQARVRIALRRAPREAIPIGWIIWVNAAGERAEVIADTAVPSLSGNASPSPSEAEMLHMAQRLAAREALSGSDRMNADGLVVATGAGRVLAHRRSLCPGATGGSLLVIEPLQNVLERALGSHVHGAGEVLAEADAPQWVRTADAVQTLALPERALSRWHDGRWWLAARLPGSDALLLASHPWSAPWRADPRRVMHALARWATVMCVLAGLLLVLERRVLAPARVRAERLRASEALGRSVLHLTPVGLCLLDTEHGVPVLQNDLLLRHVAAAERGGVCLYAALLQGYQARRAELHEGVQDIEFDVSHPMPGSDGDGEGQRHLLVRMGQGTYQQRPVLLCVVQDLTARMALQAQQATLREEAEAASRAKSRFLATMSHEIRTPLHGILGHLELFAQSGLDEGQRVRLRRMSQAAQSLLQIINDVLDLARIESGQLEIDVGVVGFEPVSLLERVALLYSPLALAKGVDLDYSVDAAVLPRYRGALARIEQVLRNLVSNAVKFTSSGRIELRVQPGSQAARLQFIVTDSGAGLTPAQVQRLFRPFMQADPSIADRYGGSGLGLSLCRELCQLMGGDIDVHSTPGVGSRFAFEVDVSPAREAGDEAWRPLAGRRVLLRSAVPPWRDELCRRLRAWGAEPLLLETDSPAELRVALADGPLPLVLFERNQPVTSEPMLEGCAPVVRVRADAPLQGVQREGDWWVSCYAGHALLDVLLARGEERVPAETSAAR